MKEVGVFAAISSAFGEDELGTEQGEKGASLQTHGLRHLENEFVSFRSADEGEGNPGVSTRRLHNDRFRRDFSGGFGGFDHRRSDPVLDRAQRVKKFAFQRDCRIETFADSIQFHEGGSADSFDDVIVDFSVSHRVRRLRPANNCWPG